MQIEIKLYAMLSRYLPTGAVRNVGHLEIAEGTTAADIIQQLRLPDEWVHLVLVNGHYIAPEALSQAALREGDALAIWPPVAGG